MTHQAGYPVVLTADRSLMAGYRALFEGMLAASQTTTTPAFLMNHCLLPRVPARGGRAPLAPLGLRRIEAALVAGGLARSDVAVVDEFGLDNAIGPRTRVVAVSTGEPLGRGMNSSTMAAIAGGRIYPEVLFRRLMARIRALRSHAPHATVVVGGPGAWQLAADSEACRELGVDHVVTGYAEGNAAQLFQALMDGKPLPHVIQGEPVNPQQIPRILGATTMGVVEISRGCGLGCHFCTIAQTPMAHLPHDTILADIATNLAAGVTSTALLSEDFLRYGAQGLRPEPSALLELLECVAALPGLRLIQTDHVNVGSVAQYTDHELRQMRELMVQPSGHQFPWVNIGVETASGPLLRQNGGAAKMMGVPEEDWGEFCAEQIRRLCSAGFFPLVSLVVGLPGEREEDVQRTLRWVRDLGGERVSVFPVLHAPVDGSPPLSAAGLRRAHFRLLRESYRLNFRWIPRMFWDNQFAAGVGWGRRSLLQALGRIQVAQWKALLAYHHWRARP